MTMALPLAFAACTSDEFESQGVDINLAERTEIGQVDLLLNQGEAETRWGGDMLPEVSDVFGAALVDAPRNPKFETEEGKWYNDYEVKDYISTNYPYTFNGNRWTSEAKLVEGNYLFYAPYAEDHQVRSAIKYAAPVVQNLKVENGAVVENSALADVAENFKSPFYFAYKFFDAADDNRNLSLTMRPIFAYPKFTLKNNTGEAVTITRIVLQSENLDIPASGEFNNSAIVTAMNDSEKGWGRPTADYVRGANDDVDTEDLLNTGAESYVKTNLIRADLSEPVTIANNGTMTFNLVVPAMEFAKGGLKVYFVNEEDMGYVYENTNSTVRFVPARPNPKEEYNVGTGAALSSAGRLLTKTLAADEPLEAVPYIVTTTAELIDAIDNATPNQNRPLKLTIGGDIEFNADVLGAIAENLSQPVVFVGALDIVGSNDAAKPLNINQKIIFDEATITGNVQFGKDANGQAAVGFESIEVVENAALTIDALASSFGTDDNAVTANNTEIVNNGTLTLKTTVKAVENNGIMSIEKDGSLSTLTSENEEPTQEVAINSDFTFGGAIIEGQWTVANGATLNLNQAATLPNKSALTVNGKLDGKDLTVKGELTVSGTLDVNVTVDGQVDNEATKDIDEEELAVVNLKKGAVVIGSMKGADPAGAEKIRDVQIVEIEDNSVGFLNTFTDDNLLARYTYTGSVTKETDLNIPAKANAVVIDGNIAAAEAAGLTLTTSVDSLTVTGNIQAINGEVSITTGTGSGSAVRVNGDVLASKKLTLTNATEFQIKGSFTTSENGILVASSMTTLILNNARFDTKNQAGWDWSALTKAVLNGETQIYMDCGFEATTAIDVRGDVIIAEGATMTLKGTATVNGDVTVSGAGKVEGELGSVIQVNPGYTLTNETTIEGKSAQAISINSEEDKQGTGKTRGQVYNYGTVKNVKRGDKWEEWYHEFGTTNK